MMPKPGSMLPTIGGEITLTSEQVNIPGHSAFRVSITAPGTLYAIYKRSATVCRLNYPAVGVYYEPGEFKAVWLGESGSPTLEPAATIILLQS